MPKARIEQRALSVSAWATVAFALAGIVAGLLSNSMAIVFDGLFSFVDVVMSVVLLAVARLVVRETDRRFQYGYWHIEPMALALNGGMLIVLSVYAAVSAISSLLQGGQAVELGWALGYSAATAAISVVMWLYERSVNREIKSDLLAIETTSWLMTAVLAVALLFGFGIAWALGATEYGAFAPYVDPAILAALSIGLSVVPLRTVKRALSEVMLVAPPDLDGEVREAMDGVIARYGFAGYTSYVAKVGRGRFVEIHILVPRDRELGTVAALDAVRAEIAGVLGPDGPDQWLTIDFTAEEQWT